MTTQQIVEDFEQALWTEQKPDIRKFLQYCPEEKRLGLFLILDNLQKFYNDAVHLEIPTA